MTDRTCSIDGCETHVSARGWCGKHYQRWRRYGDPLLAQKPHGEPAIRFLARCGPPDANGCIPWTGHLNPDGYGQMGVSAAVKVPAHKYAYQLKYGPVPDGLHLDHLCRVRHCVNPDHLEPVTPRENVLRGVGIPAVNAAKTHCIHGHPFDAANTYITPDGRRQCRTCRNAADARYHRSTRDERLGA